MGLHNISYMRVMHVGACECVCMYGGELREQCVCGMVCGGVHM